MENSLSKKDQFQVDFLKKSTQIMPSLIYIYLTTVEIYRCRAPIITSIVTRPSTH